MMKRFVFLFCFFLTFNCASIQNSTPNSLPSRSSGCSEYTGSSWFLCLEKLHARWEKIESSNASITILSETREGEFIRRKKRICWSPFFCRDLEERIHSPSFFQSLKKTLSTVLISVCIGILIGMSL